MTSVRLGRLQHSGKYNTGNESRAAAMRPTVSREVSMRQAMEQAIKSIQVVASKGEFGLVVRCAGGICRFCARNKRLRVVDLRV